MDARFCDEDCDVTAGALPLAMVQSPPQLQRQPQLVGTEVNVGNVTLTSGMKPMLQKFCDSTGNPAEKARALELLTAIEMSGAIKAEAADGRPGALTPASLASSVAGDCGQGQRPKTAAPRLQHDRQRSLQSLSDCDTSGIVAGGGGGGDFRSANNNYQTTHNYYFQPPVPSPSVAVRPASSQIQRVVPPAKELAPGNSFGDLFMSTTYGREYFNKSHDVAGQRPAPERAGSARGVRNNNPHPHREFLVWRYRRPMTATAKIESEGASVSPQPSQQREPSQPQLTNESFDRAVRGKCRTTYQQDYLGVPTTFDVGERAVSLLALEGRPAPAYDRRTTSRVVFAQPASAPELTVTNARFGQCPARAAPGILPAGGLMSAQAFGLRTRTTYETHISEPGGRLMRVADLRQLSNAENALAVARMLDGGGAANGSDRAGLMKLYREMQCRQLPASIPLPVERRIFKERVGRHMQGHSQQPAWMSTWTGPA